MEPNTYLKICRHCGEGFAKSVSECPHCGKKAQSNLLLTLIIGIGCLAMVATFAIPVSNDQSDEFEKIAAATVDQVDAAELATVFGAKNAKSDPQAQRKAKDIMGKVVQWDLVVFVSTKSGDGYQIVTKSGANAPGTLLRVFPRNPQEESYLGNIRPGSRIQVKGKISGVQQGRIKIDPAFLL